MIGTRWIFPAIAASVALGAVVSLDSVRGLFRSALAPEPSAPAIPSVPSATSASNPVEAAPSVAEAPPRPPPPPESDTLPATLAEQREELYRRMAYELSLSDASP